MKTFVDPAAEFVPACRRVFGVRGRVLDGSRAVLVGRRQARARGGGAGALADPRCAARSSTAFGMVEVKGDIERALREAKELLDG